MHFTSDSFRGVSQNTNYGAAEHDLDIKLNFQAEILQTSNVLADTRLKYCV